MAASLLLLANATAAGNCTSPAELSCGDMLHPDYRDRWAVSHVLLPFGMVAVLGVEPLLTLLLAYVFETFEIGIGGCAAPDEELLQETNFDALVLDPAAAVCGILAAWILPHTLRHARAALYPHTMRGALIVEAQAMVDAASDRRRRRKGAEEDGNGERGYYGMTTPQTIVRAFSLVTGARNAAYSLVAAAVVVVAPSVVLWFPGGLSDTAAQLVFVAVATFGFWFMAYFWSGRGHATWIAVYAAVVGLLLALVPLNQHILLWSLHGLLAVVAVAVAAAAQFRDSVAAMERAASESGSNDGL